MACVAMEPALGETSRKSFFSSLVVPGSARE